MTAGGPHGTGQRAALVTLARRWGVEPAFTLHGRHRVRVSDESLVAVLAALGVPITHPAQAPELLAQPAHGHQVLEPVLVRRPGRRAPYRLALPATVAPDRVELTVHHEDGAIDRRPLPSLLDGPARTVQIGGAMVTECRFGLTGSLGATPGYHRLDVEGPGLATSALIISAPRRSPDAERGWGIFAPLHAVRTGADWGVASYRELAELGEWTAQLGGSFVGTLPLNASFLDGPVVEPSPYRPASRLAWNELYVDVERLPELEIAPEARRLLASSGFRRHLTRLRSTPRADPRATLAAKRRILELAADALASSSSPRRAALEAFVAERPEVEAYARFRAATETLGRPWTQWAGARPGRIPAGAAEERRVRYHRYAQWVADGQLAEAAARGGLYLDLPVGTHPDGFDPWFHPSAFATGATVGAPPDSFQPAGQDWAVNPLHPERVRQDGYRYPIAALRHAMRHAAVVRIDHVMGLHRLWWVPQGSAPTGGAYVTYRSDELRAIAVLEAARAGVAVVGEDLGTVAPSVRAAMRRDGMLRSHVYEFAASADDPFPDPPADSLASIATHDLPPFASWWAGLDIAERARRGALDVRTAAAERAERSRLRAAVTATMPHPASPSRVLRALLGRLAASPARLVLVDIEDLWLEREPQNRPGTGSQDGNFQRRWARSWPEDLANPTRVPASLLRLVNASRRGGQAPGRGSGARDLGQGGA
jgi:4-alpha-glucanotransferase